jgi:ubiquinone/menaquinone biosynthesis C-methylase UbiE
LHGREAGGGIVGAPEGTKEEVISFWNSRATLGSSAGTQDLILKQLEIDAISRYITDGMRVLDAGCGNGVTAIALAGHRSADITGIDIAGKMVDEARELARNRQLKGKVSFMQGDVLELPDLRGSFDVAYTERTLINLPDYDTQVRAITALGGVLRPGGLLVMCESSLNGLKEINRLRACLDLPGIRPPWHNCYFRDEDLDGTRIPGLHLDAVVDFSSTYYFLSRVINAYFAREDGKEPEYHAPVNQLALRLPSFGGVGQTRIWLWRKDET